MIATTSIIQTIAKLHSGMNEGLYNSCGLALNGNDDVDGGGDKSFPFGMGAAIGSSGVVDLDFNNGYGCGSCYEVTCIGSNDDAN